MRYFFDFMLLLIIYFLFFYRRWNEKSKKILIINTLMYAYITMVLFVTLMPFTIPLINGTNNMFLQTANFIPFRDLKSNYNGAIREIVLNIVMMIPFGFLYAIIKRQGILKIIMSTFLFSLVIEISQLMSAWWGGLSSRSFDITDLITNTFGGLVGYTIFLVLKPLILKVLKK
ncbi:VanZ family protein [Clostridium sp. D2Q-11]|uniref:VanZ family protein n=1 Tax=Anaeromonas frigoriresistens TaxID=2683708 RepID=A0A942V2U8_9FIRM|nr:VanZ family protein [Anaeromonas frigoriresistens]MBS4538952.1 VanZ family protein [Anaeromonas frigoriresistens]